VEGDTPGTTPIMTRYSDPAVYAGIYYDTICSFLKKESRKITAVTITDNTE